MLTAMVVLIAAAGVSVTVMWWTLDRTLVATARVHAHEEARSLSEAVARRPVTEVVRDTGTPQGERVAQVLDQQGRVLATTDERAAAPLIEVDSLDPGETHSRRVSGIPGYDDDGFLVLARGAVDRSGTPVTVLVAAPVHVEEGQAWSSAVALGVAAALLVGLAGWLVRWTVGAALAPAERMRAQLAEIGGGTIDERVDVPLTGDELQAMGETMNAMLDRLSAPRRRPAASSPTPATSCAVRSRRCGPSWTCCVSTPTPGPAPWPRCRPRPSG